MKGARARRRWVVALAGLAGALGGLGLEPPEAAAQRGLRVGQPAPEIAGGPWLNGGPLSLERLRGRVVLLEFWTFG